MNTKNSKNQNKKPQQNSNNSKALEPADYEKLRGIVTGLSHVDNAHWNQSGGPDMNYIKEAMGMVITVEHMKAAGVGEWTRKTATSHAEKNEHPEGDRGSESADNADSDTADSEEAPETPLEREERERQEARATQLEDDQDKANKHDESAAKIRARVAAQKKADDKHLKDLAAKKKQQEGDDEDAAVERQKRVAIDLAGEWSEEVDPEAAIIAMCGRVYQLECLVLTMSKILLETPMTPVQRGKLANCVALLDPPSDEG